MATGAEGGAYHEIGKRYQEILARSGVRLRLVPTGGAVENLALLRNPRSGVSVALLQGGTTNEKRMRRKSSSLGTVFYEPLWLFYRSELPRQGPRRPARPENLDRRRGQRNARAWRSNCSSGAASTAIAAELLGYSAQTAAEKLLAGEIDAAIMLISWEVAGRAPTARGSSVSSCASFPHTDAYVALYPF